MFLPHQLTSNVKLLQKAAIIRHQDGEAQVLLLKRSQDALSRPNCWDLPGGNSEWPAEDQGSAANLHLADLAREVQEETALQIEQSDLTLTKLTHFSTFFDADKQMFTVIAGWMIDFAKTAQNQIQISTEHQDFAWVSAADLVQYDFGGEKGRFVVNIIQQAFAKYQQ
jgi:8-oxo-dGTP pyrophosphatase MutT (NUDIX family)